MTPAFRGRNPLCATIERMGEACSFMDDGLWGFELTDAEGYVLAFFRLRNS